MKAVQVTAYGGPEVLKLTELDDPEPGPGQVSIAVTHSAVGMVDIFFRRGMFKDAPGMPQPPFVPGLEVSGTIRSIGIGVQGFRVGERVVMMSARGLGGYGSVCVAEASLVLSVEGIDLDPALVVATIPNAAMAYAALTEIAHIRPGDSVLINGAMGAFSSPFSGVAKKLGARSVVGLVRAQKLDVAARSKLPFDRIVDADNLDGALAETQFDIIIDPVGGAGRTRLIQKLRSGGTLVACGNASSDWANQISTVDLWLRGVTIAGFNAGAFFPRRPELVRPSMDFALEAAKERLLEVELNLLPLDKAAEAHHQIETRAAIGRVVLTT